MNNKIDIILVRHAESIANEKNILIGQKEDENKNLSVKGIKQSKDVAYRIRYTQSMLDAIYSSELARAYKTARMIERSADVSLKVNKCSGLNEMYLGKAEGMLIEKFEKDYPDITKHWETFGYPEGIEGQEKKEEVANRMMDTIIDIANKEKGNRTICIVSHEIAIECLVNKITGNSRVFKIDNGEFIHLSYYYNSKKLKLGY